MGGRVLWGVLAACEGGGGGLMDYGFASGDGGGCWRHVNKRSAMYGVCVVCKDGLGWGVLCCLAWALFAQYTALV